MASERNFGHQNRLMPYKLEQQPLHVMVFKPLMGCSAEINRI